LMTDTGTANALCATAAPHHSWGVAFSLMSLKFSAQTVAGHKQTPPIPLAIANEIA